MVILVLTDFLLDILERVLTEPMLFNAYGNIFLMVNIQPVAQRRAPGGMDKLLGVTMIGIKAVQLARILKRTPLWTAMSSGYISKKRE